VIRSSQVLNTNQPPDKHPSSLPHSLTPLKLSKLTPIS
jgi:hypothetical protein